MPRVHRRQRGELTRSLQLDGVAMRSWVWGVEDSRDRQQKAASGVGFVEDSGDRNNHHNIEFLGGVESTTHAGGQGRASTPQGSDVEY